MLNSLLQQSLKLQRKNGEVFEDIHASVQEKIFISDIAIPIEEGDTFEYIQPSGLKQALYVTKVMLFDTGMNSMNHYEISYKKI